MKAPMAAKVVGVALLGGLIMYLVPLAVFRVQVSPVTLVAATALLGLIQYRKVRPKPAISDKVWIAVAIASLVLYTGVLIAGAVPNNPGDWLAMVVVFALPILLLGQIFFSKKDGTERVEEH